MKTSDYPLIRMEGIKKIFKTDDVQTHAVDDVYLDIEQGDFLSIGGPSGSGKSTLLAIMGLLDAATAGRYYLNGVQVSDLSAAERAHTRNRQIGFIFQSFNLIGDLTVFQNVELPLVYRKVPRSHRKTLVEMALEKVDMSHRRRHYPAQLSGGQQQRVAVARAVVGEPSILLADEPTGNLDSKNAEAAMELLRQLHAGGATICMVSHDPRYAAYTRRSLHLVDGRILELEQEGVLTCSN